MKNAPALTLRRGDKQKLKAVTRRRNVLFRDAQRARIILLASEGYSNMEISRLVDVHRNQIIQWRNRYESEGLNGLGDRARPFACDRTAASRTERSGQRQIL